MADRHSLDAFIARATKNPVALADFAGILRDKGDQEGARRAAMAALQAAPDDARVRSLVSDVLAQGVPDWHFRIVRDGARNAAYEAALRRAVTADTKVLEIGTGSGILAMMAARAGAKEVVTCEMTPAIADAARDVVALNGFSGRVQVVSKKSFDLDPEADMGGPADLFVSEIIDNMMVGEDALPVIEHAARILLKPGAKIIPARGIVRVALGYDAGIWRERMDTIDGFDLTPFNRVGANFHKIKRGDDRLTLLSAPADLFDFDFQSGGPFPETTASVTLAGTGGRANGIAQWIALKMDEVGWYENDPKPGTASAWAVLFWPFVHPRDVPAATAVQVFGRHDRHAMRIWA